jgi:hypothetical protein
MGIIETNATTSETAKRCEDIMTYLPRIPAKPIADCTSTLAVPELTAVPELSASMRTLHPEQTPFGGTTASYTASTTVRVTKAREQLN